MSEYKPNSHKYKEEQALKNEKEKFNKVVTGVATPKKKSDISKIAEVFISEDVKNVKSYVLMEVLVPAVKKAISDIVTNGIDMILYGGSGKPGGRSNSSSGVSYVSYSRFSEPDRREPSDYRSHSRFDYENIKFTNRGDAEVVRKHLVDSTDRYGMTTVADLYDLAGITPPHTSNKYGWTNLKNSEVQRGMDGYYIKLPKAIPLD